jgi:hypothetical protein
VELKETREMRLITQVIRMSRAKENSLAEFIAKRRAPGPNWRSWEGVTIDLNEVIGEIVGIASLRVWGNAYGIPDGTRPGGRNGISAEDYAKAIKEAGITIR